jgi:hypothetical protein
MQLKLAEVDIWRAAQQMIELYDLDAGWRAGLRADQLLDEGAAARSQCFQGNRLTRKPIRMPKFQLSATNSNLSLGHPANDRESLKKAPLHICPPPILRYRSELSGLFAHEWRHSPTNPPGAKFICLRAYWYEQAGSRC